MSTVLYGQCSKGMQSKLKAQKSWMLEIYNNPIKLLSAIVGHIWYHLLYWTIKTMLYYMKMESLSISKEECENKQKQQKANQQRNGKQNVLCEDYTHNLIYLNSIKKIILHRCCTWLVYFGL